MSDLLLDPLGNVATVDGVVRLDFQRLAPPARTST